jgi:hypothetical protein
MTLLISGFKFQEPEASKIISLTLTIANDCTRRNREVTLYVLSECIGVCDELHGFTRKNDVYEGTVKLLN